MFGVGPATRIYLAAGSTDLRKGFEGLHGLVRDQLQLEPLSGHLFIFSNAQRNRLKLLFWDGSGLWVCAKRLEKGRFRWPAAESGESKVVLSHEELALLLGGIDWAGSRRRAWFRRIVSEIAEPEAKATIFA
jgi:transposase